MSGPGGSEGRFPIKWKTQVRGQNLKVDLLIAELFRRFGDPASTLLLLKGPSVARWLYDDPGDRSYNDCDLLVHPDAYASVTASLARMGFQRRSGAVGASDRPIHAENWVRSADGGIVDLHVALIGVHLASGEAFQVLAACSEPMAIRDVSVPILDEVGRTFLVALHAAQHGNELGKALVDLELAVDRVPAEVWREAADLANRLDAMDAFSSGLRLVPAGRRRAADLGLPTEAGVEATLRASTAPHLSLGFEWLSRVPGVRGKARFVLTKLFPPVSYMRATSGRQDAGPASLALMYLRRVLWMLGQAPTGLRAWLAARRKAG